jgi:disulfide bond formation protein DsbB
MLKAINPQRALWLIFAAGVATIVGAWIFEYFGYAPCELCLRQRWAYYAAIPLALILALAAPTSPAVARNGLLVLALIWFGSMIFGIYHSGVEWKWWAGPAVCTGTGGLSGGLPDLGAAVVMCDTPAIRILGLSLAGWNAVISAGLVWIALAGFRSQGSSSVSQ